MADAISMFAFVNGIDNKRYGSCKREIAMFKAYLVWWTITGDPSALEESLKRSEQVLHHPRLSKIEASGEFDYILQLCRDLRSEIKTTEVLQSDPV